MSGFGRKADVIQGKADIKNCPLMTQSGHSIYHCLDGPKTQRNTPGDK